MNNKIQLPEPVETHFRAMNTDDPFTFLSTFHNDAVVLDAGKEYRGKAGKFERSPLPLDFHFTLDSRKIKALNITLEGE